MIKEEDNKIHSLMNSDSEKLRTEGTIKSYIDTEDRFNYKKEEYIINAINSTEIKDTDNDEEVSPELISKLEKIVSIAPKLELIIKDSLYLEIGLKIKINALGLVEKSLRNKKDGYTFFGIVSPEANNNIDIDFSTIDYLNNINNIKDDPIQYGRQFRIRFDINENCYFIKDCSYGHGYGTFMKIINETRIKDNTLINIEENYVVFTLGVDDYEQNDNNNIENEKVLSVKVFRGEINNFSYVFNQSQIDKITIGKNDNCNIVLEDNILDDIHCTIEYKKGLGWVINDGYNNKKSESGTWLGFSEETKIFEKMIIQSNQNIYECHIIK